MAHAWKACWVQALGGSNPPSSAAVSVEAPPRRQPPASASGKTGSDPSEACEHHIGERMAGVAHSAMTYRQRNPGIKRKSESTHHHPESPMCIDPPGCTWEQAPDHNSPWKTPESRGNMAFASYYRFLPCATSDSTHRPTGRAVGKTVRPHSVARSLGHSAKCALVTLAVR